MKPIEVIDKSGERVTRHNGILADGDHLRVPLKMMDGLPKGNPVLLASIAAADNLRRTETFDARHHVPGFRLPDEALITAADKARDARIKRTGDAWRSPPPVIDQQTIKPNIPARTDTPPTSDELVAARDRRVSEAWKS
jgi:hypothetical protein